MNQLSFIGIAIITLIAITAWQSHHNKNKRYLYKNNFNVLHQNDSVIKNNNDSSQLKKSIVIILNGPSTAGKSSIQKELQKIFPQPLLAMGIDSLFVKMIPEKYFSLNSNLNNILWTTISQDHHANRVCTLHIGQDGEKIINGMHNTIIAYAQAGNHIVVDYINYDASWFTQLQSLLKTIDTIIDLYVIKITAPLDVLERREKERNIPHIVGHVRSHYNNVHNNVYYDLEIDTAQFSSAECAQQIYNLICKQYS